MTPAERAFRKELLQIKGDALRMQVKMELDIVRNRLTGGGMVLGAVTALREVFSISRRVGDSGRGWRTWLRTALRATAVVRLLSALLKRR